jgi:DNA-binding XRE family transcriptional regulator
MAKSITFGQVVSEVREELGLNQVNLAKKIGIKQSAISKIENNMMTTNVDVLIKMAKAFRNVPSVKAKLLTFLFE